jgi:methyl-accepting chemotaxis protein
MKVVNKFSLVLILLLVVCGLGGGWVIQRSYDNIRRELFKWFDQGTLHLGEGMANSASEAVAYYDYQAIEKSLADHLKADPDLLYAEVRYGDNLGSLKAGGDEKKSPYRRFEVEHKNEEGKVVVKVRLHYSTARIDAKLRALIVNTLAGAALTLLLLMGTLYFLVLKVVNRPLRVLADHARLMAGGDLRAAAQVATSDEFGYLARQYSDTSGNLREMVGRIRDTFVRLEDVSGQVAAVAHVIAEGSDKQAGSIDSVGSSINQMNSTIRSVSGSVDRQLSLAENSSSAITEMASSINQVARNSELLSQAVEDSSSSIAQISVSVQQVADNVESLTGVISEVSSAITEMDYSVKEVEKNAGEAFRLSESASRSIAEEGQAAVQRAVDAVHAIKATVDGAARIIKALGERTADIGQILNVIKEVNEQTNLLALNASIIAAQAREHGRGFAVVADEIRELSARTAASTKEIATIIGGVQNEAKRAVVAMEDGAQSVDQGVRIIGELTDTLQKVAEASSRSSGASRVIAKATTEQSEGIKQISMSAQNMNQMSKDISRATREQSQAGAQIIKVTESMKSLAMQVKKAMQEQAGAAQQISKSSEESATMSRSIAQSTREEAESSQFILRNVEGIRGVTQANLEEMRRLEAMVKVLTDQAQQLRTEIDRFQT